MDDPFGAAHTLLASQLAGIADLHTRRRRLQEQLESAASREQRMDTSRALDVVQRVLDALRDRLLSRDDPSWALPTAVRAVIAHHHPWFAATLAEALTEAGAVVLCQVGNGADAIGVAVAEAPELVFVDAGLEMVTGVDVARELARCLPSTVVIGCVETNGQVAPLLDAGASAVFTQHVAACEVVREALASLDRERSSPRSSGGPTRPVPG